MLDTPQVSQAPDPIATMPTAPVSYIEIPKDVSGDFPVFQVLTESIKDIGNKAAAFAISTAVAVGNATVSVVEGATSMGRDVMNPNHFVPQSGKATESPSLAQGKSLSQEVEAPSTSRAQEISDIDRGDLMGFSTPNVPNLNTGQAIAR